MSDSSNTCVVNKSNDNDNSDKILYLSLCSTCTICIVIMQLLIVSLALVGGVYIGIVLLGNSSNSINLQHSAPTIESYPMHETATVCLTYKEFMRDILNRLYACQENGSPNTRNVCKLVMEQSKEFMINGLNSIKTDKICMVVDQEYKTSLTTVHALTNRLSFAQNMWDKFAANIYQDINIFETIIKSQRKDGSYKHELKILSKILKNFEQNMNKYSQTVIFKPFVTRSGFFNETKYLINLDPYTKDHKPIKHHENYSSHKPKKPENHINRDDILEKKIENDKFVDKNVKHVPNVVNDNKDVKRPVDTLKEKKDLLNEPTDHVEKIIKLDNPTIKYEKLDVNNTLNINNEKVLDSQIDLSVDSKPENTSEE